MNSLLLIFVVARLAQLTAELSLAWLNRRWYSDGTRQGEAMRILGIASDDMQKTLAYSRDKYRFAVLTNVLTTVITLAFLAWGGLGWIESTLRQSSLPQGEITQGLMFFAGLGFLSFLLSLPFEIWHTFRLEARHGFNKQTRSGFIQDRVKGILLAVVLGGPLLALVLWIMSQMGPLWWVWAWTALSLFSLFTAWAFPVLISPLFNKFSPLPDGELKAGILELARKIGFRAAGISIMDGSRRTSHGNAYFTGVFGAKKIVLFDTLVSAMTPREVIAVLAHELGHFKLHHIRWSLVRGLLMTGLVFWLLSLALPMTQFYEAFGLAGVSHHGALVVFSLWFGLIEFLMQPLSAAFSRRNEFAADRFAWQHLGQAQDLINALRKLREQSRSMPISHPLFSAVYHSHPPLLERLQVLMRL